MTDALPWLALGLVVGLALGGASYAGLWWTVRRAPRARRPGRLLALSALSRGAVLLAGLLALAAASPWALGAGLLGVLVARTVATWLVAPAPRERASRPREPAPPRTERGGER